MQNVMVWHWTDIAAFIFLGVLAVLCLGGFLSEWWFNRKWRKNARNKV